jgi:hypothetical protein
MHKKRLKGIKELRWKKSKLKMEAVKIGLPDFPRTDRIRLGFEIYFV